LTFSYGRALQQSCLKAWKGSDENISAAQDVLVARARANGQANLGQYTGGAGGDAANASTFVKGYVY
jgi:fructose-bisphosphate aldolase, class I